jgi:hypothetical protein
MYSEYYHKMVNHSKEYHLKKDVYSGIATINYSHDIKNLVDKHNAKTLLDYGCGKGHHYDQDKGAWFNDTTFDKWLNIESVYLFDPAVPNLSVFPKDGQQFDAVIAIQSLAGIPDQDFPIVVDQLMKMTKKFCFIGTKLKKGKSSKSVEGSEQYFKEDRVDPQWWKHQFQNWTGSEIVLKFID